MLDNFLYSMLEKISNICEFLKEKIKDKKYPNPKDWAKHYNEWKKKYK